MALLKPTNAEMTPTTINLRKYNHFSENYILDRKIITTFELPNITEHDDNAVSAGAGTADLAENNSSEICALLLNANNESYGFQVILPHDMDPDAQVDFRYLLLFPRSQADNTYHPSAVPGLRSLTGDTH